METPETLPFNCEKCGTCCRHIKGIKECEHLDRGDGVCKYYNEETKECKIYDFRPDICNVVKMYYKKYNKEMTWEEYVNKNKEGCKYLRELEGKK